MTNQNIKISVNLKKYCIQTAVKKYYEKLLLRCLKGKQSSLAELMKQIEPLKNILESCDFSYLRSHYPELNGSLESNCCVDINISPDHNQIYFFFQDKTISMPKVNKES